MSIVTDRDYPASALVAETRLSNADIRALELGGFCTSYIITCHGRTPLPDVKVRGT